MHAHPGQYAAHRAEDSDVAGQAQTGTGKTAAFLIAAYQRLLSPTNAEGETQPRAFMLAPTRELAIQIANDAELLGKHTGLKIGSLTAARITKSSADDSRTASIS